MPHLEIAHQPFRKGETYNEQLGERTRKEIGDKRWNRRVRKAIATLDALFFFDHLYIGGGNARRVERDELGECWSERPSSTTRRGSWVASSCGKAT